MKGEGGEGGEGKRKKKKDVLSCSLTHTLPSLPACLRTADGYGIVRVSKKANADSAAATLCRVDRSDMHSIMQATTHMEGEPVKRE